MNKVVVCLMLSIFTVLLAAPANAQAGRIRIYVPFEFNLGPNLLPAGDYVVDTSMGGGFIRLSSAELGRTVVMSTHRGWERPAEQDIGRLVFHQYGNAYFLSQVINGLSGCSYLIPMTKAEQTLSADTGLRVSRQDVAVLAKR